VCTRGPDYRLLPPNPTTGGIRSLRRRTDRAISDGTKYGNAKRRGAFPNSEFRERFKERSLTKNQIRPAAHSPRALRTLVRERSSVDTPRACFLSWCPPTLSLPPSPSLFLPPFLLLPRRCSQRPPPRQSDPGGSFQDTVGYPQRIRPFIRTLLYSLHNIVPPRSSPSSSPSPLETLRAPRRAVRGRNTRVAIRLGTVYPTPTLLWCEADGQRRQRKRERERGRGRSSSRASTKAPRLSRLICCYSCLRDARIGPFVRPRDSSNIHYTCSLLDA